MLLLFGLTRFDCISLKLHNWFQDILNLINAVDREAENTSVHWKIFVLFFKRNLISDLKHWFDLLSVIPETLLHKPKHENPRDSLSFSLFYFCYKVTEVSKMNLVLCNFMRNFLHGQVHLFDMIQPLVEKVYYWWSGGEKLFLHIVLVSKALSFYRVCWSYF